ncbi:Peroxiredoxin [Xenococcus sp. PCC 7305]|uniref:thioredoxin-dependent thiol peroxidase n=1 Tax=Xenococcus sp. PCC 7305 TaxID=102125 RepID=UPI0002AD04DB|nr:thioredoxin-dependent thiol peroxidase [Xenococcus sp. PCC 7305]ELS02461.1 Peroxiredoxin [Xenococcus sp. PCC 7305]
MTDLLKIGQKAPNFLAQDQNSQTVSLDDFRDRWLVLYFYPKDDTPGCTVEAIDFTSLQEQFSAAGAAIVGVSPDSEASHCKFIAKHNLEIQLLSDPERKVMEAYHVWRLKKFMGKEYMGVVRSTFLIAPDGNLAHIWNNVRAKGHGEKVLEKLLTFSA